MCMFLFFLVFCFTFILFLFFFCWSFIEFYFLLWPRGVVGGGGVPSPPSLHPLPNIQYRQGAPLCFNLLIVQCC